MNLVLAGLVGFNDPDLMILVFTQRFQVYLAVAMVEIAILGGGL